jgi:hypothetical protein
MHAKNLGFVLKRHVLVDIVQEVVTFVDIFGVRDLIMFGSAEAVHVLVDYIFVVIVHQNAVYGTSIVDVCDATAIVGFGNHVP